MYYYHYCTHEKCPYSEHYWFIFSFTWTEYGDLLSKSPNSARMWENADHINFEYRHFLRGSQHTFTSFIVTEIEHR